MHMYTHMCKNNQKTVAINLREQHERNRGREYERRNRKGKKI